MKPQDVIIFVMAIILFLGYTEACSCMMAHPQELFCRSHFVILARIKSERRLNNFHRVYKVRVRKEYKMSEKAAVALKSGRILTPFHEMTCGVTLEPGKLYVLSGRVDSLKAQISLCDSPKRWEDHTRRQRKGLKMLYKQGCNCKINHCRYSRCTKKKDVCNWTNECHLTEGICLKRANNVCKWTKIPALSKCVRENPLTISR